MYGLLTWNSKRIEQQIKGIQDKAETVKTEVRRPRAFPPPITCVDQSLDDTNPVCSTAVTTSSGSISATYDEIQNKIPRDTQPTLLCYQNRVHSLLFTLTLLVKAR